MPPKRAMERSGRRHSFAAAQHATVNLIERDCESLAAHQIERAAESF
jgi:hypothetical protein